MKYTTTATCLLLLCLSTTAYQDNPLTIIGDRKEKNCLGVGRNVALYVGPKNRFFYATHELGDIFHLDVEKVTAWNPHFLNTISPAQVGSGRFLVRWTVTENDVIIARIACPHAPSPDEKAKERKFRIVVRGDCRKSFDWRGKPGGEKITRQIGNTLILTDKNVYPLVLPNGLTMAIGSKNQAEINTTEQGTYEMTFQTSAPAASMTFLTIACAIHPDSEQAQKNLSTALEQRWSVSDMEKSWTNFYKQSVPRFECSNRTLNELYGFRWFLLRFSTAGGNLGYFKYPVVLEGRQAYQTYCCYSAPFMAYDLNWATDASYGFGHIANMIHAQYEDGRFPWYTSPRTNKVPLHHASASGLSLMPHAAWKHYLVHGDNKLLAELYSGMKKNVDWWIKDRDPDGDGLFLIDDQLETGMDDLFRWAGKEKPKRYEAIDASCYAHLNLLAVANIARELGQAEEDRHYRSYAEKTRVAINQHFWDANARCWKDRHPQTKELANYVCITTFYPFFATVAGKEQLSVLREYLLNPNRFGLPFPVPALPKDHPQFNPNGFWQGPSWPAATSHVVEGFAATAKRLDRTLLPEAGQLFLRAASVHMTPRADFYERYNPLTGQPLSTFRDYMHSWWIDNIIRHAAGVMLDDDGRLFIDPLPLGLEYFKLEGVKWRGRVVDVLWRDPEWKEGPVGIPPGLTVKVNGTVVLAQPTFKPGQAAVEVKP